jgi:dihydroanticapsin dehydrogenase
MTDGVAVITGGASGIGLATARAFVAGGAHAVIVDRDAAAADQAARGLGEATAVTADVSREAECRRVAERTREVGRPTRWLVNCAASFLLKGEDATAADWDHSLGVNVKGSALMASAVVPLIREAGGSAIVNVASISGWIAQPNH